MDSRHVHTTEQMADMMTKGACTSLQCKSPIQLFDVHPPPKSNVDRSFSESCCSAVSPRTSHATCALSPPSKVGLGERSWKIPQQELKKPCVEKPHARTRRAPSAVVEHCSAWRSPVPRKNCSSAGVANNSAMGNVVLLANKEARSLTALGKKFVEKEGSVRQL